MTQSEHSLLVRDEAQQPQTGNQLESVAKALRRDRALEEVTCLIRSNDLTLRDLELALGSAFFRSQETEVQPVPKPYDPYF